MCATSNMKNVHRLYDILFAIVPDDSAEGWATECDDSRLTNIVHGVRLLGKMFLVYNPINVTLLSGIVKEMA